MRKSSTEVRIWPKTLAWGIDQLVLAIVCAAFTFMLLQLGLDDNVEAWSIVGVLAVVPALAGALCVRGRTLGTLAIGTEFFALSTGRTAGSGRMAWIAFIRWLLPVTCIFFVIGLFSGGGADDFWHMHEQRNVSRAS